MKRKYEDRYHQDLHNVLSNKYGRRFVLDLINRGRQVPSIGGDANMTYYNQGLRQSAEDLEADLRDTHFDMWQLMMREAHEDAEDSSCNPSDD